MFLIVQDSDDIDTEADLAQVKWNRSHSQIIDLYSASSVLKIVICDSDKKR